MNQDKRCRNTVIANIILPKGTVKPGALPCIVHGLEVLIKIRSTVSSIVVEKDSEEIFLYCLAGNPLMAERETLRKKT